MTTPNQQNFDSCVSFFINSGAYQGRIIRMSQVLDTIIGKHCYPAPVAAVVAEGTVLAALLASTLKYEGLFTLQTQSDGPVSMIVVDVTSDGVIRACAKYDEEHLRANQELRKTVGQIEAAPHLMGKGHLAFTVDQGPKTDLYQGVVDLQGKNFTELALRYFKQSEQIDTDLKLFLLPPREDSPHWLAAGIMLQKMPSKGGNVEQSPEELAESWNEAKVFMESLTADEIFNADLSAADLLHRLFHGSNLQIANCKDYRFGCRCSREKLLQTLSTFSEDDINAMIENNKITATCHFCNETYSFDHGELSKQ